jgi:hypothetical protein
MQLDAFSKFELELDRIEMLYHTKNYSSKPNQNGIYVYPGSILRGERPKDDLQ